MCFAVAMQDDLDAEPQVLLDPNALSTDGTVALSTYSISKDGKYFAYGLSESGSDWVTIRVMRIADRQPTSDKLSWVSSSRSSADKQCCLVLTCWFLYNKILHVPIDACRSSSHLLAGLTMGKAFSMADILRPGRYTNFLTCFNNIVRPTCLFRVIPFVRVGLDAGTETNINLNQQIYYHVMGSDQSEDILCWKDPENPKYSFGASVTEDGKVPRPSTPFSLFKPNWFFILLFDVSTSWL
jgi:prolyl oligopeptidase